MDTLKSNPATKLLLREFQKGVKLSVVEAALFLRITKRNTEKHIQYLHAYHHIYICTYRPNRRGHATPVYAYNTDGECEDLDYFDIMRARERNRKCSDKTMCM